MALSGLAAALLATASSLGPAAGPAGTAGAALLGSAAGSAAAPGSLPSPPTGGPLPRAAVQRYMDMQLGMFLHFGINTFTNQQSGDGNATRHPPSAFAPVSLNTSQWVSTARALGAKYMCLTAQHEGGFALWNSSYTNYSSALPPPAGFGVDVLSEFVRAAEAGGVAPCIYFSVSCDAYHGCPGGACDTEKWFIDMKLGQLRELLGGRYGKFACAPPIPHHHHHRRPLTRCRT